MNGDILATIVYEASCPEGHPDAKWTGRQVDQPGHPRTEVEVDCWVCP